jgi:signal transduction histidine kinase
MKIGKAARMCWEGRRTFSCDWSSPRRGREFSCQHLGALLDNAEAAGCVDDASLIISELLTNAATAGGTQTKLHINVHRDHIHIGVYDNGPGWPKMQRPTPDQGHGRGLQIIDQLATDWGVEASGPGKEVWADIAIDPHLTDGIDCDI